MGRFNMWLANLMRGRYGMDQLNRSLMIVALILIVINFFFRLGLINWLAVVLLIYIYCRMFSRNISRRAAENQKFMQFTASFRSGRGKGNPATRVKKDQTHKILKCPGCGEKLRVPRGVGKISISCPHCHMKFTKKV